ncbi:MAG: response regulator transcription factor [Flavobacteriales bacterium]|jgi:DNA-binding response OmpR family regulator|nr:response regulator transcription factor [Flavobacteriales bacterium]MBK7942867.1 response regulator transcription factor [Flavobacteriales bacterium]MBK8948925.1 response regulator transcription factor [Flavobacteriales bacterium]MBK9698732.1 response regulator transcription factor [Flavobacteriales bacterium]
MAPTPKLLVVEDDPNLGTLLAEYLRVKGFEVDLRADGEAGLKAFRSSTEARERYDLLLLDVMMPVKDGFTLAREIRRSDTQVPIIFLTAKSMKQDTIQGFQAGADDYLTKPFSMEELVLRVQAVLRRSAGLGLGTEQPQHHTIGSYTFDVRKQLLRRGEEERKLTTKESELLRLLCLHRNGLLERRQALREIWGDDNYFNGRSMDVYIAKLRKHLREDPEVEIINIHGQGFRLAAREQA